MSDALFIFACDDRCARKVFNDNQPDTFPDGFVVVRRANDLAGEVMETIDVAKCEHRWSAGTRTAWKHFEWCAWQLDPVEERWADEQRKMEQQFQKKLSPRRLGRDKSKDS